MSEQTEPDPISVFPHITAVPEVTVRGLRFTAPPVLKPLTRQQLLDELEDARKQSVALGRENARLRKKVRRLLRLIERGL